MEKQNSPGPYGKYSGKAPEEIPLEFLLALYEKQRLPADHEEFIEKAIPILKFAKHKRLQRLKLLSDGN